MGRDAARRAGLSAEDFVPYVSVVARRDWTEVLGAGSVNASHRARYSKALRDVWNTGTS